MWHQYHDSDELQSSERNGEMSESDEEVEEETSDREPENDHGTSDAEDGNQDEKSKDMESGREGKQTKYQGFWDEAVNANDPRKHKASEEDEEDNTTLGRYRETTLMTRTIQTWSRKDLKEETHQSLKWKRRNKMVRICKMEGMWSLTLKARKIPKKSAS